MRIGYTKPELKEEKFTPEADVSVCMQLLTGYDKCIYLDMNHSGRYTRGEFMNDSARMTVPSGHYLEVQAYSLLRSTEEEGPLTKYDISFSVYNHEYTTSIFTLGGLTKPRYQFVKRDILDVKVANGRAFFNLT